MSCLPFSSSFSFSPIIRAIRLNGKPPTPCPRLTITMLPTEILLMIQDLLRPASAASFVLCSRAVLTRLGNRSLLNLRSDDQATERRRLLSRLARDLQHWLLCYHCCVLHPVKSVPLPVEFSTLPEKAECTRANDEIYIEPGYSVRFSHAQLIMRDHRQGRCTKKALQQLSKIPVYYDERQHTVQGNITNRGLVITTVSKYRLHSYRDMPGEHHSFLFCDHISGWTLDQILSKILTDWANDGESPSCKETEVNTGKCKECPTSYTITVSEPGKISRIWTEVNVKVEMKRYLGSCKMPFKGKWSMHIGAGGRMFNKKNTVPLWTAEARDEVPEGLKVEDSCHR